MDSLINIVLRTLVAWAYLLFLFVPIAAGTALLRFNADLRIATAEAVVWGIYAIFAALCAAGYMLDEVF